MKFLIDAHLPPRLAVWLRTRGHDAEHVEDAGLRDADDAPIRDHALTSGAILVTKDRDFVREAPPLRMIWVRTGNVPNSALFARFGACWTSTEAELSAGADIVEVQ